MIESKQTDALSAALTGMFRTLELRPLPEHLRRVVEQLDVGPQPPKPRLAPA